MCFINPRVNKRAQSRRGEYRLPAMQQLVYGERRQGSERDPVHRTSQTSADCGLKTAASICISLPSVILRPPPPPCLAGIPHFLLFTVLQNPPSAVSLRMLNPSRISECYLGLCVEWAVFGSEGDVLRRICLFTQRDHLSFLHITFHTPLNTNTTQDSRRERPTNSKRSQLPCECGCLDVL